nr:porin [Bradyrhizobium sp. 177]
MVSGRSRSTSYPVETDPVLHAAVAPSPAPVPAPEHTVVSSGGAPLYSKAPGGNPFIDNTTVTLYGHVDLSGDIFNAGVYDQGSKFGVPSNLTYFGVRAPYGYPGWAAIAQFESLVEVAAVPTERAAFGTRDSFIGMESPWGTIKAGKADTPYKKATSKYDPSSATLGDYNSIMGNTGGDLRAEFDWRASHAIWYESPMWYGFQAAVMVSPGQNTAKDNSDYALGDSNCPGTSARGSGSGFPLTSAPEGCTDGSYGNLYSASLTYNQGPFTAVAAYELHESTNRIGDEAVTPLSNGGLLLVPPGSVGVANEWAAKFGAGYKFNDMIGALQLYGIYEIMRREHTDPAFNERSRDGYFVSATQTVDKWDVSASCAHANSSPG